MKTFQLASALALVSVAINVSHCDDCDDAPLVEVNVYEADEGCHHDNCDDEVVECGVCAEIADDETCPFDSNPPSDIPSDAETELALWYYNLYDKNNDGCIDKCEFSWLYNCNCTNPDRMCALLTSDELYDKYDLEEDSPCCLSDMEFIQLAFVDPEEFDDSQSQWV